MRGVTEPVWGDQSHDPSLRMCFSRVLGSLVHHVMRAGDAPSLHTLTLPMTLRVVFFSPYCDQWHSQCVQQALTCPARVGQRRKRGKAEVPGVLNFSKLHAITKVGLVGSFKAHDTPSASSGETGWTCDLRRCLSDHPLQSYPRRLIDLSQCFLDHSKAIAPPLVRKWILLQWMVPPSVL